MLRFALVLCASAAIFVPVACGGSETTVSTGTNDAGDAAEPNDTDAPDTPDGQGGGPTDTGTPAPVYVTTTNETIDVDGEQRAYVLQVPVDYTASRAYPLIVALHGDGGTAASFRASSKIENVAKGDAIVAYTEGSVDLFTPYNQNPDQRMIEVIIGALKGKYRVDAAKVWGFGYSKGAFQLNEIACKKPGLLSAMAIHAGGAPQTRNGDGSVNCPNAIGLPAFITEGANDDPNGGEFGASYWASRAGCTMNRSPTTPPICQKYDGCAAGKPVVYCLVPNQPHAPMYDDAAVDSWTWFTSL